MDTLAVTLGGLKDITLSTSSLPWLLGGLGETPKVTFVIFLFTKPYLGKFLN